MKKVRLFCTVSMLILIALTGSHCTLPRTERPAQPVDASATRTAVATAREDYLEVFEIVWQMVDQTYFDPDFEGLDWESVHDEYEPLIAAADGDETLYQLLNQMMWELNVSHAAVGPEDGWRAAEPVAFAEGEIGVDVRLSDGQAVITHVEARSPAEEAGLQPGFVIQSIDGVSVEQIIADAEGHLSPPYNEQGRIDGLTRRLLGLLYGDPQTSVTMIYMDGNDEAHEQSIERIRRQRIAPITGVPLPPSYLEFETRRLENDVGYIRFNTFHPDLIPDLVEAVATFHDSPGIIIDLRGNPGGDLSTGVRLAGQFLDADTSFGSFRTREETGELVVAGEGVCAGPVVILIDALSYSCSEWFTSGMQAAGRAVIVGERSPGGATAMNVATLPNGALLGYPVAQLRATDGTILEGHGVIPDVAVTLDRGHLLAGIDDQLEAGVDVFLEIAQE